MSAFIIRKSKTRKTEETEVSLKWFLKKTPIYGGNDLYWKLTSPTPTNVKSISSHCR